MQPSKEGEISMITRREFVVGVAGTAIAGKLTAAEPQTQEYLVASCGLYCGACPMYLQSQQKDDQKTSAPKQQFGGGMGNVICDGCLGNGRIASFCRSCAIRDCATKKTKTKRCADCSDYPCSRITAFNNDGMVHHSEVLENCRKLRSMGIKDWAKYEEERWHCPQCKTNISWYLEKCPKCGEKRSDRLFPLKKA
jgi:hypothetical protein